MLRRASLVWTCCLGLGTASFAADAVAQAEGGATDGFDVERFEPTAGAPSNVLNVTGAPVLDHLQYAVGLSTFYVNSPLEVFDRESGETISAVGHQLKAELLGSIGLMDRFEVGLGAPVALLSRGDGFAMEPGLPGEFSEASLADMRVHGKYQVLSQQRRDPLGVAVQLQTWLPTGNAATFTSDRRPRVEPRVIADWERGRYRVGANLGYRIQSTHEVFNHISGHSFRWRMGGQAPVWEDKLAVIGSLFGDINTRRGELAKNNPTEVLGGVRAFVTRDITAEAGAGFGLTSGVGSPQFRAFATMVYRPGRPAQLDPCEADPASCRPNSGTGLARGMPDPDGLADPVIEPNPQPEPEPEPEPQEEVVQVKERHIEVKQNIHFRTDSTEIAEQSMWLIEEIANVLRKTPQLTLVRIEGHTDSRGGAEYNQRLSDGRAAAVLEALVIHGITPERLRAVGRGLEEPLADNDTPEGRLRNRRVEFHIVEVDNKPVGARRAVTVEDEADASGADE